MAPQSTRTNLPGPARDVDILWAQRPAMRDGVRLNLVVYLPKVPTGPLPTVVELTPYGLDRLYGDAVRFASEGLAFVAGDVRGRGDSEGAFRLWTNEPADLRDVIDWCAAQPWCNGRVGLYGSSYTGANQWMALKDRSLALRTIIPAGTSMSGYDLPWGGVPNAHGIIWGVLTTGRPTYWNHFASPAFWSEYLTNLRRAGRPFTSIPVDFGIEHADFLQQATVPAWGPVWEAYLPSAEDLRGVDFPILTVTGQNDSALLGTLKNWSRFHEMAPEQAREFGHLIIGPWAHGGMEGSDRAAELHFGHEASADIQKVKIDWYRWALGAGERPAFVSSPVTYYVCGVEEWRRADALDDASDAVLTLHLGSLNEASDVFHSGHLTEDPPGPGTDSFTIDLDDLDKTAIERAPRPESAGLGATYGVPFPPPHHSMFAALYGDDPTDQAFTIDLQGMGLVYHSAPFADGIELCGVPRLDLDLSVDAPDADLCVFLHEIRRDGSAILLSSTIQRLSYRNGSDAELLAPDEHFALTLWNFRWVSRRLASHSRLRLTVRALSGLYYEPNDRMRRADGARIAAVSIRYGGDAPSRLTLPLAAPANARA